MSAQKVASGAMPPDREKDWLFKIKGVKEGAQKALWAAMDMGNNLFASNDNRTLTRQTYTWLTIMLISTHERAFIWKVTI